MRNKKIYIEQFINIGELLFIINVIILQTHYEKLGFPILNGETDPIINLSKARKTFSSLIPESFRIIDKKKIKQVKQASRQYEHNQYTSIS